MTQPLTDQQLAAIEAGRAAVRARFAGGAFPAALGQAIADELADAAMAPVLAELKQARADVLTARAAGYRSASNDVAELRNLHGQDFDTDMVMVVLDRGAQLREAHAAQAALTAPACSCRAETVHQRGCGGEE